MPSEASDEPVAVVGADRAGRVTFWSAGAVQLYGVAEQDALGKLAADLVEWHAARAWDESFEAIGEAGYWSFHHRATTRAGRELALRSIAMVAAGPDSSPELLMTSRAVEPDGPTLAEPGPMLQVILSDPSVVTTFLDEQMTIVYVSGSLEALSGFLTRDLLGSNPAELLMPDDRVIWRAAWDWALAHPMQYRRAEFRVIDPDGEVRWSESNLINLLSEKTVTAVVVSTRDVTAQHGAAEALVSTERTLRSMLDSSVEGVWITDRNGQTTFTNDRMRELLQLRYEQTDDGATRLVLDETLLDVIRRRVESAPTGGHDRFEISFIGADGQLRWLRLAVVPSFDQDDELAARIVLCSELPDRPGVATQTPLSQLLGLTAAPLAAPVPPRAAALTPWAELGMADDQAPDRSSLAAGIAAMPTLNRLSQRELDVVIRLLLGDRVPAIAEKLFVSQSTVRNQLSAVFRKLGVSSQQELIALLRDKLTNRT